MRKTAPSQTGSSAQDTHHVLWDFDNKRIKTDMLNNTPSTISDRDVPIKSDKVGSLLSIRRLIRAYHFFVPSARMHPNAGKKVRYASSSSSSHVAGRKWSVSLLRRRRLSSCRRDRSCTWCTLSRANDTRSESFPCLRYHGRKGAVRRELCSPLWLTFLSLCSNETACALNGEMD